MYHIKAMAVTKQMDHKRLKTGAEYQPETALEHVSHHLEDSEQLCKVVLKESNSTVRVRIIKGLKQGQSISQRQH